MKIQIANVPPHPIPLPRGERVVVGGIHLNIPSPLTGDGEGGGAHSLIPPTSILPRKGGGSFGGCPVFNSRGISVLFLVVAMMLMVAIGYVFSYLIPTKQKSVALTISSNQAFFLAQSGVEFAVQYATEMSWATPAQLAGLAGITKNLGGGRFILTYTNTAPNLDTLTSVGEVPISTEKRRIAVRNFTSFLPQSGLVLWTPVPCWPGGSNANIRFSIKNVGSSAITLNRFSATWLTPPTNRDITTITLGANTVFSGSYNYPSCSPCVRNFTPVGNTQTVNPDQVISVQVTWNRNISGMLPVIISFYDTTGVEYQFTLEPTGNC